MMLRKNENNPFVKKWVSGVWDFNNGSDPFDITNNVWSEDTVGLDANTFWRVGAQGRELYCDTASFNNNFQFGNYSSSAGHQGFTVRFKVDSTGIDNGLVRHLSTGLYVNTSGSLVMENGGADRITSATGFVQAGTWHTATVIYRTPSGTDDAQMWLDGVFVGQDTAGVYDVTGVSQIFSDATGRGSVASVAFFCEHAESSITGDRTYPNDQEIAR